MKVEGLATACLMAIPRFSWDWTAYHDYCVRMRMLGINTFNLPYPPHVVFNVSSRTVYRFWGEER